MIIECLRSEPEIFDPVYFQRGINIITGERSGESKSGNKTNGVGKTLLINFIDFCLLAKYNDNRISRIPSEILNGNTNIILEINRLGNNIVVKRNRTNENSPTIYLNGKETRFSTLEVARKYLHKLLLDKECPCSMRDLIRAFKRKEKEGFTSIDNPDGSKQTSIYPYLYLFDLDTDIYKNIEKSVKALVEVHNYSSKLKEDIENLDVTIKEAGARTNELKSQVEKLDKAIEELSQHKIYEEISSDISRLDNEIRDTNLKLISTKEEIKQIEKLPEYQKISKSDILAIYNDCKQGLGDLIIKEINEIEEFKNIIDSFKKDILNQRKIKLIELKNELLKKMEFLSNQYKKKISVLDKRGHLRSLKTSLHEQELKNREYSLISSLYDQYQKQESKKITIKAERGNFLSEFSIDAKSKSEVKEKFQETVLEIHNYLYGNNAASFNIEIKETKRYDQRTFVYFHLETDDSGSVRTEHEKVLVFDFSLLFCPETRKKHLRFIIHDGAFEGVNEDTKYQILNWLYNKQANDNNFQYIVTINRDSFESIERSGQLNFNLSDYVRKNYTKESRFLKTKYAEKISK